MSTTTMPTWEGTPKVDGSIVAALVELFESATRDGDVSADAIDSEYYLGYVDAISKVLSLVGMTEAYIPKEVKA